MYAKTLLLKRYESWRWWSRIRWMNIYWSSWTDCQLSGHDVYMSKARSKATTPNTSIIKKLFWNYSNFLDTVKDLKGSLMRAQGWMLQVCRARLCHFERFWHRPGIQEPWDLGVQRCLVVWHFYVHLVWCGAVFIYKAKYTSKNGIWWMLSLEFCNLIRKDKETRCCWSTVFAPSEAGFGTRTGARGFVPWRVCAWCSVKPDATSRADFVE